MEAQDLNLRIKFRSSPNIAWIKYWGKYDEEYILPINDSLGLTLNHEDICTITQISFSNKNSKHQLILNNEQHPISKRLEKIFSRILLLAYERKYMGQITESNFLAHHFRICSENSFPTASGMASSASGLACLAAAVNGLFGNLLNNQELSELARLGSGSASRSIWGGLVHWKGVEEQLLHEKYTARNNKQMLEKLSKKCISQTLVSANNLKFIKVIILLANNEKKQISSTSGMQTSVETSQLILYRNKIAAKRSQNILKNLKILENLDSKSQEYIRNFNQIIQTIIKDSNQFHAICLDTYPPIFYLNQFSRQIMYIVDHLINKNIDHKVSYTFDAGPHAFLFMHECVYEKVLQYFVKLYQWWNQQEQQNAIKQKFNSKAYQEVQRIQKRNGELAQEQKFKKFTGSVIFPYQIWVTDVGIGATRVQ